MAMGGRPELEPPALPFPSGGSPGEASEFGLVCQMGTTAAPASQGCGGRTEHSARPVPGSERALQHETLKRRLFKNALGVSNCPLF